MTTAPQQPITLLVCALGGEGGGVLTEWLIDTARHAGYAAQATSIPGVAQRTGATTYYIEVHPVPLTQLGGRKPVFSLNPVPGTLDALVSSELLETARQIGNGMASADRTCVISSSARTLTTAERMQMGDGRTDADALLRVLREHSLRHAVFDMSALARECGTVVSAVMLGAVAGSGLFPFAREHYEAVVKGGGASAAASLRGFAAAYERMATQGAQAAWVEALLPGSPRQAAPIAAEGAPALPSSVLAPFPAALHDLITLAHARLCEYQSAAYAAQYLARLQQVVQAERSADAAAAESHGWPASREMARWLALWMAFDDIVRVADLKCRATRAARVRAEVRAGDQDLLRVVDHFKPSAPEFAALLPEVLARRVLAWDARRVARGQEPWALPLKVRSDSVRGLLALRTLAALRRLRPLGSRFAEEQRMIGRWLGAVLSGLQRDRLLGLEVARCGRLIKGYGSTNERGKANLLHVIDHLAALPDATAAAQAIARAREAALQDEAGTALDATLRHFGAPARPVREQPVRFVRKPRPAQT